MIPSCSFNFYPPTAESLPKNQADSAIITFERIWLTSSSNTRMTVAYRLSSAYRTNERQMCGGQQSHLCPRLLRKRWESLQGNPADLPAIFDLDILQPWPYMDTDHDLLLLSTRTESLPMAPEDSFKPTDPTGLRSYEGYGEVGFQPGGYLPPPPPPPSEPSGAPIEMEFSS